MHIATQQQEQPLPACERLGMHRPQDLLHTLRPLPGQLRQVVSGEASATAPAATDENLPLQDDMLVRAGASSLKCSEPRRIRQERRRLHVSPLAGGRGAVRAIIIVNPKALLRQIHHSRMEPEIRASRVLDRPEAAEAREQPAELSGDDHKPVAFPNCAPRLISQKVVSAPRPRLPAKRLRETSARAGKVHIARSQPQDQPHQSI